MRTFKYRIRPSPKQVQLLWKHSCLLNDVYNTFIDMEQKSYEEHNSYLSHFDLCDELIQIKQDRPELKEIHSQVLQQVAHRVHRGYQAFFKGAIIHPPNFRSCRRFFNITYPQNGYSIRGDRLFTKVYGDMRIVLHRPIQGNIKQISITHNEGWYVTITTDYTPIKQYNPTRVAIDLGTTNLVTTDHGETIRGPTHQKNYDKRIDYIKSKRDATCTKGSRRFRHLSKVVRHLYSVKNRKTNDKLHKISKDLSRKYDTVFLEQLNLKTMSETKATGRNRKTRNACIGKFVDMLKYKMTRCVEVNPMYTSQTCSLCHHKLERKLDLKHRTFNCPNCNLKLDRDHNAAINILQLGLAKCSNIYKSMVSIVDLPPLVWLDDDLQHCLGQAIV